MSELFQKLKAALAERYQLEVELGSGGMATVYRALDLQYKRRVAIKLLHPELAGAVGQDRFLQEIRFVSELTHPHILPLLDTGIATVEGHILPYYVMPFVEGESLRAKLLREKQLQIHEALEIARDVASALSYAHSHGVVHRDIKPENILLAGTEAVVADFGIARAINRAAEGEVITSAGLAVGTPAYMSPEQSSGGDEVDGRSDIYALGCVLYEMLGGEPPFTGSSSNAILARHRVDPVPSLTTIRPTVPTHVEIAIRTSLHKLPADRYATASLMSRALGFDATPTSIPTLNVKQMKGRQRFWLVLVVLAVAVVGTLWAIFRDKGAGEREVAQVLDTTLYAIIPSNRGTGASEEPDPSTLLRDAMARWSGVNLIDPFKVRGVVARDSATGGMRGWEAVSRESGAGRYVRVDVSRIGTELRVHAILYDTQDNRQLADHAERLSADYTNSDTVFAVLAERLLFRPGKPTTRPEPTVGTTMVPAKQAFQRGYEALEDWNLIAADSAFDAATRYDPQFAQAFLWLAMVRMWSGNPAEYWRSPIERALGGRERLSLRDRQIADAVLAQARENYVRACGAWSDLAEQDRHSFIAWYGWGDCLKRDNIVLRNSGSPTGWRFRSSYHQALESYQRAFELLPSIHRGFSADAFSSTRSLLHTSENDLRGGKAAPPDTMIFFAAPSWQGDSLVFFPIPYQEMAAGRSPSTATTGDAILHQQQRFQRIASAWVAATPTSAEAELALAVSLEIQGNRNALDALRRARSLATSETERLRVGAEEVRMLAKFSIPDRIADLQRARSLADSILLAHSDLRPAQPRLLATLAALTGHAHRAARLSLLPEVQAAWGVPPGLMNAAPFLVYAAMGEPGDSLRILEQRVGTAIDQDVSLSDRDAARLEWLAFPATLAFPNHRLGSIRSLDGRGDILLNAQAAFARGDSSFVHKVLMDLKQTRRRVRPSDMALDNLVLEAWLLAALGDPVAAAAWLDPTLGALASSPPQLFSDPFRTGPLVRAMALRADLAAQVDDHTTARRWAKAVLVLWSGADDVLLPLVKRMETRAR